MGKSISIGRVGKLLVFIALCTIVGGYAFSLNEQRQTERQKMVIQQVVAATFDHTANPEVVVDDPHGLVADCGPSPRVQFEYGSALKHRFDYRVICNTKWDPYVVVRTSDDGRHAVYVQSPPANMSPKAMPL
ncbi:MAG: hypothetical protein ABI583_10610 [Betaproteobacteria bacterium]